MMSRTRLPAMVTAVVVVAVSAVLLHYSAGASLQGLSSLPAWSHLPSSASAPSQPESCRFSYARFHLYFTIPPTALLFLLHRPFLTRLDRAKLILLPLIAFIWTTPWDNELVRQRAWSYPRSCVLGTLGWVPYEEYFFFLIQSVMTTLLVSFTTRWMMPSFYVFRTRSDRRMALLAPATLALLPCAAAFSAGLWLLRPGHPTYYLAMILWWCSVPLALLGWGSAGYISKMTNFGGKAVFCGSLLVPTMYLWATDVFALRRGTWHINEKTSLQIFPVPDVPVEEMVFFLVTNLLLVVASFTFDRCVALSRMATQLKAQHGTFTSQEPALSPSHLPLNAQTIGALWRSFVAADLPSGEHATDPNLQVGLQDHMQEILSCFSILARASQSFSLASLLLPWDLRMDLSVLYAFCRAADDCIDDFKQAPSERGNAEATHTAKQQRIGLLRNLVAAVYADGSSEAEARSAVRDTLSQFQEKSSSELDRLSTASCKELRASASAVVSLRDIVPRALWDELLRGYERDVLLDLHGHAAKFETMDDVIEYAQCVAGSVGEMCVRVVLARGQVGSAGWRSHDLRVPRTVTMQAGTVAQPLAPSEARLTGEEGGGTRDSESPNVSEARYVIYQARRMGVALQLVNIARDVVDDSIKLKRCYLPLDLLPEVDAETAQKGAGAPAQRPDDILRALFGGNIYLEPNGDTGKAASSAHLHPVSPNVIRPAVLALLDLATHLYHTSLPALNGLADAGPRCGIRPGAKAAVPALRAACSVYFGIADEVRSQASDAVLRGTRARMAMWRRLWVALRAVYTLQGRSASSETICGHS